MQEREGVAAPCRRRGAGLGLMLALGAGWLPGQVLAQGLAVEAVTLSSGGLAEVRRAGTLAGSDTLYLEVPLEQVDDVLKSLVVRDPAGQLRGLTLDGPSGAAETFQRLPFAAEDLGSVARLAATLQGVTVRAASGGKQLEGQVLGVEQSPPDDRGRVTHTLALLDAEGEVATLLLGSDARLTLLDDALRERLAQAADASGRARTDAVRRIAIALEGEGERDVSLSYVVAAPVWKSAYRLLLDGEEPARLQAWAVVENASGSDWSEVALTLSSGAPVTLTQRLLERYWAERPEVPVSADATAPVRQDEGALRSSRLAAMESSLAYGEMAEDRALAPPSAPAGETVSQERGAAATWRLPFPVDLEAGRTLSLPYVDASLPARRVSLYQPERGERHPVAAVRLENTTGAWLPPGLVTVYDAEVGHVGDLNLPGVPAGESRLASFASDRLVRVVESSRPEERLERLVIVDGALRITHRSRRITRYRVENDAGEAREVLIEHPLRQGWEFSSEALVERTPSHQRLGLTLAAGESGEVEAVETLLRQQSLALVDADLARLVEWRGAADEETAGQLEAVLERRRALAEVENELERLDAGLARAGEQQARIRDNLAVVGTDNALGQRYLADLEALEERIVELGSRREAAEGQREERRQALAEVLRALP
ncbi:DUF4139 domain-containing protein [Halomonas mongoliensis]|uniref:DUF4139 domain-containing protein n=1 Tax=Halomonas mongoliensis TaxID=321265 RepID=UPI00403B110A